MRKNLDRAEEILARVKSLSKVYAAANLYSINGLGRMGRATSPDRMNMVNRVFKQMEDASLTREEREDAGRSWLDGVAFDLYYLMREALVTYEQSRSDMTSEQKIKLFMDLNAADEKKDTAGTINNAMPAMLRQWVDQAVAILAIKDVTVESIFKKAEDRAVDLDQQAVSDLRYSQDLETFLTPYGEGKSFDIFKREYQVR